MSTNTPEQTNTTSQPNRFRISPVLDIPKDAEKARNMVRIDAHGWNEWESGYQESPLINGVEWSSLRNTIVESKKQVETGVIATMAVPKKTYDYRDEFGRESMIIVNNQIVLKNRYLTSADINENGQMVYTLDSAIFMKEIYDDHHRVLPIPPNKKLTPEESQEKREKEKQEFEQAPKYPSILQGPFITSSWHIVIVGTKKGDEGTHLYIDHQEIPLDIHEVNAPLKIEGENIFISFKTPIGENRITKIELDNSRERPKKGDYLIEGYRALTQQQFRRVMDLEEQRDNLMDLHDDKIIKLTGKDAEIAELRRLLDQEKRERKQEVDALNKEVRQLKQEKESHEEDISEMEFIHRGVIATINEAVADCRIIVKKNSWIFRWNNLEEQIPILDRISKAAAQIKHTK